MNHPPWASCLWGRALFHVQHVSLLWSHCETYVVKGNRALCFPGKQYLTRRRMTRITTPCQRSGQGGLPGERGSALGDNQGLCQNPATPGRDWPGSGPTWGLLPQRREDSDSSMVWNTSTLWNGSLTQGTPSVFPNQGIRCAGHNLNPVEPKIWNWKLFPVNFS